MRTIASLTLFFSLVTASLTFAAEKFPWPVHDPARLAIPQDHGIAIYVSTKVPVKAVGVGTVIYAGNELKKYGKLVLIRHDSGFVSVYAHLTTIAIKRGDVVKQGDKIATFGPISGKPLLYFELRNADAQPVNPIEYLEPCFDRRIVGSVQGSLPACYPGKNQQ